MAVFLLSVSVWHLGQRPRGDEVTYYLPDLRSSSSAFPLLDQAPSWPVSPYWTWAVSAVARALGGNLIGAGRLLSLLGLGVLLLVGGRRREGVSPALLLLVSLPYVLVYAVRCHPFLPALAFLGLSLVASRREGRAGVAAALLAFGAACNLQYFALGALPWLSWPAWDVRSVRRSTLFLLSGFTGVAANWLSWGALLPPAFLQSVFFRVAHEGKPPQWVYGIYVLAFLGAARLLAERARRRPVARVAYLGAIVAGILATLARPPVGPVSSVVGRLGLSSSVVWGFLIAGGIALWIAMECPHDRQLALSGLLTSGCVTALPYLYERLVVFAALVAALGLTLHVRADESAGDAPILGATGLGAVLAILYFRLGSL